MVRPQPRRTPPLSRSLVIRKFSWAVVDQAISSSGTLVLTVVVARSVDPDSFGSFALTFAVYVLATSLVRAVTAEPAAVLWGDVTDREGLPRDVLGFGLAASLAVAAAGLSVSLLVGPQTDLGALIVVLALTMPGLVVQDMGRALLLVSGRANAAALNSGLWLILQIASFAVLAGADRISATSLLFAWGSSAAVCGALALVQLQATPRVAGAGAWLSRSSDLAAAFLVESLAASGAWQLSVFALGAIASTTAVGSIRGAQTIFGPITMVFLAAPLTLLPILSEKVGSHRHERELLLRSAQISGALGMLALTATAGATLLPDRFGSAALGASWPGTASVLVPFGMYLTATGCTWGALLGLRTLRAVRRTLPIRLTSAGLLCSFTLVGAWRADDLGFAVGLALASSISAAIWWTGLIFEVNQAKELP